MKGKRLSQYWTVSAQKGLDELVRRRAVRPDDYDDTIMQCLQTMRVNADNCTDETDAVALRDLSTLVDVVMGISITSASGERGFSNQSRVEWDKQHANMGPELFKRYLFSMSRSAEASDARGKVNGLMGSVVAGIEVMRVTHQANLAEVTEYALTERA